MGQAAGVTAALAARTGRLPTEAPWDEVAGALAAQGARVEEWTGERVDE